MTHASLESWLQSFRRGQLPDKGEKKSPDRGQGGNLKAGLAAPIKRVFHPPALTWISRLKQKMAGEFSGS